MNSIFKISIYSLVGFLGAGINFLIMPYLSHFINPREYGVLSMINSYVTILIPLIGLVASGLVTVDYFRIKDKEEFASLFSSLQLIPVIPCLIILFINITFPGAIASLFEIPSDKTYWLSLSVIIAFLSIYTETLFNYTIAEQKSGMYATFNISKLLIEVFLTLWFVVGMNMSWEGRLLSWLITSIIFFFIAIVYFRQRDLFTTRISKKYFIAGLSFGIPLILHTLGKFVINQSDRIFIAKMASIEEAGIYNIGYQVGMIMLVLVNAIGNFIYPYINLRLEDPTPKHKREIVRTSYTLAGISFIFLVLVTAATPTFFAWLVDSSYADATRYVFWVALSYFFWGIYLIFSSYIFYANQTGFLAWVSILNIILNAGLNYILILRYGAIGAAYATSISFFAVCVIVARRSNKLYPLPWTRISSSSE